MPSFPVKFLLILLAAGMAVAQEGTSPPHGKESLDAALHIDRSLLSTLLLAIGYRETCVSSALDSCASSLATSGRPSPSEVSDVRNQVASLPRHCKDLLDSGDSGSGLRQVYPYPGQPLHRVTVYCDHTVDGGGWTVFQRRSNDTDRQDFYRSWVEYQLGFGDLNGEFWLGLDLLHQLTSTTLQQLRVDLDDYEGEHRWAKYGFFHVGAPETKYRLHAGRYSGDAEDCFSRTQSNAPFSTYDSDNDSWNDNCAKKFRGAWWYKACHESNLNGYQYQGLHTTYADGINWREWKGYKYSLRRTTMMIRPAF